MPELPEVEILVRHLAPLLKNKTIRSVRVRRARVIAPTSKRELSRALRGATFTGLTRRGKYLLFTLRQPGAQKIILLVGHLGMTGRIYLLPKDAPLPKHAAVALDLGRPQFHLRGHTLLWPAHTRPARSRQTRTRTIGAGFHRGISDAGFATIRAMHQNQITGSDLGRGRGEYLRERGRCSGRAFHPAPPP